MTTNMLDKSSGGKTETGASALRLLFRIRNFSSICKRSMSFLDTVFVQMQYLSRFELSFCHDATLDESLPVTCPCYGKSKKLCRLFASKSKKTYSHHFMTDKPIFGA